MIDDSLAGGYGLSFWQRNVFLRVFISSLGVVRYIEEREVRCRNVFMIVFNGSME